MKKLAEVLMAQNFFDSLKIILLFLIMLLLNLIAMIFHRGLLFTVLAGVVLITVMGIIVEYWRSRSNI